MRVTYGRNKDTSNPLFVDSMMNYLEILRNFIKKFQCKPESLVRELNTSYKMKNQIKITKLTQKNPYNTQEVQQQQIRI